MLAALEIQAYPGRETVSTPGASDSASSRKPPMRGERWRRLGEYLVGRACQQLPRDIREERYREWVARAAPHPA